MHETTMEATFYILVVIAISAGFLGLPSIYFGRRNGRGGAINFMYGMLLGPIGWMIVHSQKALPEKEEPYHVEANRRIEAVRRGDV